MKKFNHLILLLIQAQYVLKVNSTLGGKSVKVWMFLLNSLGFILGYNPCPNCNNTFFLRRTREIRFKHMDGKFSLILCKSCITNRDKLDPEKIETNLSRKFLSDWQRYIKTPVAAEAVRKFKETGELHVFSSSNILNNIRKF